MLSIRKIYKAVAIPQIIYGASLWWPYLGPKRGGKKLEILQAIQTKAMRIISGAFKATSVPALHIETFLLPMKHLLNQSVIQNTLRLVITPAYQEILKAKEPPPLNRRERRGRKDKYKSPLKALTEVLENDYTKINEIETFRPFITSPSWQPPNVYIEDRKRAAETANELEEQGAITIYTDGSGINNKIGAAAVSKRLGNINRYVGSKEWYTVYSGEVYALHLAMGRIIPNFSLVREKGDIHIFIDNQATIQRIKEPGICSAQATIADIIEMIDTLREFQINVILHWIPAHKGHTGNELADQAAKQATGWRKRRKKGKIIETDTNQLAEEIHHGPRLASAIKSQIKEKAYSIWEKEWKEEKRGEDLRGLQQTPSGAVLKIHRGIKRAISTLIMQMRTEKIGLRSFLYNRWVPGVEDDECPCGWGKQTAYHILLICRNHSKLRSETWSRERRKARLGEIPYREMLTNHARTAVCFMRSTGLLEQFKALNEDQNEWI